MKYLPETLVQNLTRWKLPNQHVLSGRINAIWVSCKKPHILLRLFLIGVMAWASVAYFLLPSINEIEGQIALRPAQWSQMENLIQLSKANAPESGSIEPLDDAGLQKVRTLLAAKGIKPNVLRLGLENPPRIELQANDILFSAALDALEELRVTLGLYPERIEMVSRPTVANVNLSTTLRQVGVASNDLNSHGKAGLLSR